MQTIQNQLIREIRRLGLPVEFALVLAGELKTEKMIRRMVGYLRHMEEASPEEIADEMLAILADRDTWREKKINEYYNARYNRYLNENNETAYPAVGNRMQEEKRRSR